jgi:hypothetical protein
MNEKEGLNLLDFLPTGFNKRDPFIQAFYSDDTGRGALADEIESLIGFIDYYTRTDDIRNHAGATLDTLAGMFANITRQLEEDDARLLRRTLALTARKGDKIWGNALDIKHVFETYFKDIHAYISENTGAPETSLLRRGDFEDDLDGRADDCWTRTGSAVYTGDARFAGKQGVYFDGASPTSVAQVVEDVGAGLYTLHFFLKGRCGVRIRDDTGRYWDGTVRANHYALKWRDEEYTNWFETADWENVYMFVRLTTLVPRLSLEFVVADGHTACIDHAQLFPKPPNPSFTVTVQYEGYAITSKTLHLGAPAVDPAAGVDYSNESYYDHAYIVGRMGAYRDKVYQTLLDAVRPRGIQAFVEFVEREYISNI